MENASDKSGTEDYMKKWLILLLLASSQMSLCVFAESAIVDDIEWQYTLSKGNAIDLRPNNASQIQGSLVIPSTIDGHRVVNIQSWAFYDCRLIESVIVQDSIVSMGEGTFEKCHNLKTITIPNSVTNIARESFYDCTNLMSITIGTGVKRIGEGAFYNCSSLSNITIPQSVKMIDKYAFQACSRLNEAVIPDSVTKLDSCSFSLCGLKNVVVGKSVRQIGTGVFAGCNNLTNANIQSKVIGDEMFSGCRNLTNVNLSDDVESIGYRAFYNCASLSSIPSSAALRYIGERAFENCTRLGSATIPSTVTDIGAYAFQWCSGISSVRIPNGVTVFGEGVFDRCTNLSTVLIGNGMKHISSALFSNCSKLTSIALPNSIEEVRDYAFQYSGLNNIVIPNSVTNIGDYAFRWCTSLQRATIGHRVKRISSNAFYGCENLKSVYFFGDRPTNAAQTISNATQVKYPEQFATSYETIVLPSKFAGYTNPTLDDWICFGQPLSTSDSAKWFGVTSVSRDGYEALRSGAITHNETSWLETTISGPGRISFWWKTSSEEYGGEVFDYAYLSVDGIEQGTLDEYKLDGVAIGGNTDWTNVVLDIVGEGTHVIQWIYCKDEVDENDAGEDCVWLDEFSFTPRQTIHFEIGEGASGNAPDSIQELAGANIILPNDDGFYWADHIFDKWTDGLQDYAAGARFVMPLTNVTLTAKWIAKSLVSFDIGDGTGTAPETIKDVPNAVVTLPMADGIEWIDHVFNGWSDGESVYPAGADYTVPTSNITLSAQWIAKSFVSFDIGNGTGETPSMIKALPDEIVSLPTGEGLTLTDYAFGGWTDGAANYTAGDNYIVPETNTTLTAVWIAKRFLTFTLDGGDGEIPITIKDVPNATVTLPSGEGLSKPKYTFVGWSDGTQTHAAGTEYVVTDSSIEFSAVWEANTLDAPLITSADVVDGGTIETANTTIEISADSGATIYYTLDGATPTTNSIPYVVPFMSDGMSVTIRAFAVKDNYFDSDIAAFSFNRKPYSAAECLNADGKTVSTGDNDTAWVRVLGEAAHDGVAALRSGEIGDGESSTIEMTVDGAGEIGYWWKSSSEISRNRKYDYVSFLIDGVEHGWLGGEKGWTNEVFSVSGEGTHTLKWVYTKNDNGLTQGEDCAWLDEVKWTPWCEITTKQTVVPIPYGWLESYGLLKDTDAETAVKRQTGKRDGSGRFLTVEDDFIAGTDPTDGNDLFTVSITISNGVPVIAWKPNLNTNGENRVYTIYGKESLSDEEWITPTNSLCRFFKVGVAVPTKEENHDSTGGDNGSNDGGNESGGNNGEGNGNNDENDTGNMIPSGYSTNAVQCVSCTGSEWYDLGLPPTLTMRTQIKCSFAGENEHMAIIGVLPSSYNENDKNDYRLFIASSPFEWFLDFPGSSRIRGSSAALNEVREVEFGNFYVKDLATDSMLISGSTVTAPCPSHNLRLFRTNYYSPSKYTTGSVYYVRIYDLNASNEYELVRNLVPCKSDSDEVGLLDLVEKKFYKSDGTSVSVSE